MQTTAKLRTYRVLLMSTVSWGAENNLW